MNGQQSNGDAVDWYIGKVQFRGPKLYKEKGALFGE